MEVGSRIQKQVIFTIEHGMTKAEGSLSINWDDETDIWRNKAMGLALKSDTTQNNFIKKLFKKSQSKMNIAITNSHNFLVNKNK